MQRVSRIMIVFQLMFTCLVTLGTNANAREVEGMSFDRCHFMIGGSYRAVAIRDVREEENNIAILNSSVQVVNNT